MNNLRIFLVAIGVLLLVAACKTTKNQETSNKGSTQVKELKEPIKIDTRAMMLDTASIVGAKRVEEAVDTLYMTLTKTPCYGRCPVYTANIYTSGYVVYEGKRFVEKEGMHASRMTQDDLSSIRHMARTINYFGLEDEYDREVTDLPTTYTTIHFNGQRKTIKNRADGPDVLNEFENHVEKILEGLNWKPKSGIPGR